MEEEKPSKEPQITVADDEEDNKKKKKHKMKNKVKFEKVPEQITPLEKEKEEVKEEEIVVKIETVRMNPDKSSPLVGYFPSGFDPLKVGQEGEHDLAAPQHRVGVFRNVNKKTRFQLAVRPNGSQIDLVGTSYSGEAAAAQLCSYALGVLDKATQTLKIVPITANKIVRLEPRVGGAELIDDQPSEVLKEELPAETKADKLRDLTLMYSTKKTIRKAKKLESLNQKQDPRSQVDLDRKIEGIKINMEAFEVDATTANSARHIPPHDMAATTLQMAYPLDKIIFKGEWDYLFDILELCQVGAELAPDVYPSFVCNRIYKLEAIKDEGDMKRIGCIFSYLTHLIKFKDKHSMEGVSSAKYHKFPSILSLKFSSMFANSDSKRLSDEKRDLLISYVLVLTLFADGFRTDPSDIARDLRMNAIALRPHYEHLGCKLIREGNVLLATLPVPLQFPVLRRKRRRR